MNTSHPFPPSGLYTYRRAEHIAAQVQEARKAQPDELLAAILMLTVTSEATATAVDVKRLRATGQ